MPPGPPQAPLPRLRRAIFGIPRCFLSPRWFQTPELCRSLPWGAVISCCHWGAEGRCPPFRSRAAAFPLRLLRRRQDPGGEVLGKGCPHTAPHRSHRGLPASRVSEEGTRTGKFPVGSTAGVKLSAQCQGPAGRPPQDPPPQGQSGRKWPVPPQSKPRQPALLRLRGSLRAAPTAPSPPGRAGYGQSPPTPGGSRPEADTAEQSPGRELTAARPSGIFSRPHSSRRLSGPLSRQLQDSGRKDAWRRLPFPQGRNAMGKAGKRAV